MGDSQNEMYQFCAHRASMTTLIKWNVSKALEKNPFIDLREAIQLAQKKIESCDTIDVGRIITENSEERYLICAVLAWQELRNSGPDALYSYISSQRPNVIPRSNSSYSNHESPTHIAPVLPFAGVKIEPQIIMQASNSGKKAPSSGKKSKVVLENIEKMCTLDSECCDQLQHLETMIKDMKVRTEKMAQRAKTQAVVIERAEASWRDLERGYQRRLFAAKDKEDDYLSQTKTLIEDRNAYKNACNKLALMLNELGNAADKDRMHLGEVVKTVCTCACEKQQLMENMAKQDNQLAEQMMKVAQLDRDLKFKEEQAKRQLGILKIEVDGTRSLAFETERNMRADLKELRDQIAEVTKKLLDKDSENTRIKKQIDDLMEQKEKLVENLRECKAVSDKRRLMRLEELRMKKEQLRALKFKVLECRCKNPIEIGIQAERTPSLSALCRCEPEDAMLESCSCTSLRTKLLATTLTDLFGGLHMELANTGIDMPCQLLKCLEDDFKWDKTSATKTNLRNFFANLLKRELDVAIASSITKYHAKWASPVCVDKIRRPGPVVSRRSIHCPQRCEDIPQPQPKRNKNVQSENNDTVQTECDCDTSKRNRRSPPIKRKAPFSSLKKTRKTYNQILADQFFFPENSRIPTYFCGFKDGHYNFLLPTKLTRNQNDAELLQAMNNIETKKVQLKQEAKANKTMLNNTSNIFKCKKSPNAVKSGFYNTKLGKYNRNQSHPVNMYFCNAQDGMKNAFAKKEKNGTEIKCKLIKESHPSNKTKTKDVKRLKLPQNKKIYGDTLQNWQKNSTNSKSLTLKACLKVSSTLCLSNYITSKISEIINNGIAVKTSLKGIRKKKIKKPVSNRTKVIESADKLLTSSCGKCNKIFQPNYTSQKAILINSQSHESNAIKPSLSNLKREMSCSEGLDSKLKTESTINKNASAVELLLDPMCLNSEKDSLKKTITSVYHTNTIDKSSNDNARDSVSYIAESLSATYNYTLQTIDQIEQLVNDDCICPKKEVIIQEQQKAVLLNLLHNLKKFILYNDKYAIQEQSATDANMNRAYKLLHCYLQSKIDRIQKLYESVKENGVSLHQMKNMISSTIHNDFQRLQCLSKCKGY